MPSKSHLTIEQYHSIAALPAAAWDALNHTGNPFISHAYLNALEATGCVGDDTGWQPMHQTVRDGNGTLIGAMPLYRKTNSWGEFVFDFAWADAYQRAGLTYYPKLVSAAPYTPVTGARMLVGTDCDSQAVTAALLSSALQIAQDAGDSSLHVLFPDPNQLPALTTAGLELRKDCQFHWHNRNYQSFDDFLDRMKSRKAKKLRRERRRVSEAGIAFQRYAGENLSQAPWNDLYRFYATTFLVRGRTPYFPPAFFDNIRRTMQQNIVVILARRRGLAVAAAICFRNQDTFFGRYWGADADYHSLHFETCYYQGIEYCIDNGLQTFEPGTQGEHKLIRGFEPTTTWSAHWLAHVGFRDAIGKWLAAERDAVDDYVQAAGRHLPWSQPPPQDG